MIQVENITVNGRELVRTWSDAGRMLENEAGERYSEAIDPLDSGHIYAEVEGMAGDTAETYAKALEILGVDTSEE